MDLKNLRSFYLVGKHGTLLGAANRLHLSPAAISIQLKKLEAELGAQLFDRRPNKLSLTHQGARLLKEAARVFEAVDRASAAITDDGEGPYTGKITMSLGNIGAKFFAPPIASFIKQHPSFGITMVARQNSLVVSQLMEGDVDLVIGQLQKVPRGVEKVDLFKSSFLLACPSNHPLARKGKLQLKELSYHRLIIPPHRTNTRKIIEAVFLRNRIEMKNFLEVNYCNTTVDFVRLGLGAGIVHDICVLTEPQKNICYLDVSDLFGKLEISLVFRRSAILGPAHRAFVKSLIDYAHRHRWRLHGKRLPQNNSLLP